MNTSIEDLKTDGFVALAYPLGLRSAVDQVVIAWEKFCALPLEVKQTLPYSNTSDGVGYEMKEGAGNKVDKKENFDVTLAGREWLQRNVESIGDPVVLDFVQKATELVEILKPTILDFARQTETAFGLEGFANEVDRSEGTFFVRFIHYFVGCRSDDETATAHIDQSGFTPHLFESAPGLQRLTYEGEWSAMPVSSGETIVIPGMQLQLRSKGTLRALCHRVVATPETARTGRYSAVCFVQLKDIPKYDKARYGRLQEMEPGFNYDMSHEEFSKFFK